MEREEIVLLKTSLFNTIDVRIEWMVIETDGSNDILNRGTTI